MRKTEKDIINSLKELSDIIKPNQKLDHESREMLLDYFRQTFPRKTWFSLNYYIYIIRPAAVSLLVLLFVFFAGFSLIYGTESALPGDSLYSIKLSTEKARMALIFNQSKKTVLYAEILTNRLSEVKFLAEKVELGNKEFEPSLAGLTKNFTNELNILKKQIQDQVAKEQEQEEIIPFPEEELLAIDRELFIQDVAFLPIQDNRGIFTVIQSQELENLLAETKKLLSEKNLVTALVRIEQAEEIIQEQESAPEEEVILPSEEEEQAIEPILEEQEPVLQQDQPTIKPTGSIGQLSTEIEQEQNNDDFSIGFTEKNTSFRIEPTQRVLENNH